MIIYKNREDAHARAIEVARSLKEKYGVSNFSIEEGTISFCGPNGEKFFRTFEVSYERYDRIEGWMDCVSTIVYAG